MWQICQPADKRYCLFSFNRKFVIDNPHSIMQFMGVFESIPICKAVYISCLQGTADDVVDFSHGKQLWELCKEKYEPLWIKGGNHCDLELYPQFIRHLKKFISAMEKSAHLINCSGPVADLSGNPQNSTDCIEKSRQSIDQREKSMPSTDQIEKRRPSIDHREKSRTSIDKSEKSRTSTDKREKSRTSTDKRERTRTSTDKKEKSRTSTDKREKLRTSIDKREKPRKSMDGREKACAGTDQPEKARKSIDRLDKT